MKIIQDILRGVVIGLANIIPGVSGGTMMVSMGIYDTIINCINTLFKDFKRCMRILWPYALGMVLGILGLAKVITFLLGHYPMQTNLAFIGLIFGGLPIIVHKIRGEKKGIAGAIGFVLAFALVIGLQIMAGCGAHVQLWADDHFVCHRRHRFGHDGHSRRQRLDDAHAAWLLQSRRRHGQPDAGRAAELQPV